MSQRAPLRPRSSLGHISSPGSSSQSSPVQSKPRVNMTDLRRPPSRNFRPASPKLSAPPSTGSRVSRPSSAMANFSSSRPSTPSFASRQEPYTGSITVSIRPNPYSVNSQQPSAWDIDEFSSSITNTADQTSFKFDNVFPPKQDLSNREVYQKSCSNIVDKFLNEGYNGTIFAYGMTGSGKTFSMKGSDQDPGFITLAIDAIWDKIETAKSNTEYTLSMSYLEIYNEKIVDLLQPSSSSSTDLKIRDDTTYGTKIIGITSPVIASKYQIQQLISKGDTNRKTSATDFNARSSRSHSILQLKLNKVDLAKNVETHCTLSLCDLAGSERAVSSLERRKEGSFINKSLLALSTVINKLSLASSSPHSSEHIPYRDSKLTRLLQPALSGSSLISILCTIHLGSAVTSQQFTSETYNTLRFAARAKDIVMDVQKNKVSAFDQSESLKLIENLKSTVESQKHEIMMLKMNGNGGSTEPNPKQELKIAQLEAENKILNEKLEHLTRITDLQKTETIILKNDTLNDILGSNIDSSQMIMANLEEYYKRVNYEMEEQRSYIQHLENQVQSTQQELSLHKNTHTKQKRDSRELSERQYDSILKDQEEEILQLKELLKDKDHLIRSLTKTTKLRRLVESNSLNQENYDKPVDTSIGGKENENVLRSFKIGPKSTGVELESQFM